MARADATTTRVLRSLEQVVDIETPEQVVFSYTVAGIGSRAAAALIDYFICWGTILALYFLVHRISGAKSEFEQLTEAGSWALAIAGLVAFAAMWGYFVFFEALSDGQTPGKRKLGLRVVQDGGYSMTFSASAVRNLARIIDMQPGFLFGVGIISALVSKSGKRLGDILAGTIVVKEKAATVALAPGHDTGSASTAPAPVTALLTDDEYALLDRYMARRLSLDEDRRREIAAKLVTRFEGRLPSNRTRTSPQRMLVVLHEREQTARAQGASGRGNTGAAREQHLIVARGTRRWGAFAKILESVRRRGLHTLPETEVSDFVSRYREITGDLARLRTASRGHEPESLYYLSRLVAGGHNLLYRRSGTAAQPAWRYLVFDVPAEIRRSWRPILLSTVLLFAPMLVSYNFVVRHPERARELLPAGMIDRAEGSTGRKASGRGYVEVERFERPVLASRLIANNVQVTFAAFAAGMTAGLGTAFLLIFNGIGIGAAIGLYASKGIAQLILSFVVAHGVLELSAICIAGGGGFLIASAMLLPGERTRWQAIVLQGQRAIRLITATTLFLLVAGSIEGLISPRDDWTVAPKIAVAVVSGVLMLLYVATGRKLRAQRDCGLRIH
ncbi:MAG: stage II sporulation protein M [Gemmatimonadaceae bacterium]